MEGTRDFLGPGGYTEVSHEYGDLCNELIPPSDKETYYTARDIVLAMTRGDDLHRWLMR